MDRHETARHESGHAIVAASLGLKVHRLTIEPDTGGNGRCQISNPCRDRGRIVVVAGIVAVADHDGIRCSMVNEASGRHDIELLADILHTDGAKRFAPGSRLRRSRSAFFDDPAVEELVERARSILRRNVDVHADLTELLLLRNTIEGDALADVLRQVRIDLIWSREKDVEVKERVEAMRKQNAKQIGEQRRKDPGDRGYQSRFVGGFATTEERDRMLARCGLGADKFGPRGVAVAQRILDEYTQIAKGR